jgi:hypothetical protein
MTRNASLFPAATLPNINMTFTRDAAAGDAQAEGEACMHSHRQIGSVQLSDPFF